MVEVMNHRAALSDLVASVPAGQVDALHRASDAFDAGDKEAASDFLSDAARAGQTSWHRRADELSDVISLQADLDGLAMHAEGQTDIEGRGNP